MPQSSMPHYSAQSRSLSTPSVLSRQVPITTAERRSPPLRSTKGTHEAKGLQPKPYSWLAGVIRKHKEQQALEKGWQDDEWREKRTSILRTFDPSHLEVTPTAGDFLEVRAAVVLHHDACSRFNKNCKLLSVLALCSLALAAMDQGIHGHFTVADIAAAFPGWFAYHPFFAFFPWDVAPETDGYAPGYFLNGILKRRKAIDTLQRVWYSLEQEYYWVSRDDLVQHFDDIFEDQDCQLPTDDLLID